MVTMRTIAILSLVLLLRSASIAADATDGNKPAESAKNADSALTQSESVVGWNSKRLKELGEEWNRLLPHDSKTKLRSYGDGLRQLEELLKKRLTPDELHQLAISMKSMPVDEGEYGLGGFEGSLLQATVDVLIERGDRDSLVTLLSAHCPVRIGLFNDIELAIALWGEKMKEPITVLGDAFERATDPKVRTDIAAALRRGFSGLGVQGKDDAEFVKNAMKWYAENKGRIEIRREYVHNRMQGSDPRLYAKRPLFKFKESAEVRKE